MNRTVLAYGMFHFAGFRLGIASRMSIEVFNTGGIWKGFKDIVTYMVLIQTGLIAELLYPQSHSHFG